MVVGGYMPMKLVKFQPPTTLINYSYYSLLQSWNPYLLLLNMLKVMQSSSIPSFGSNSQISSFFRNPKISIYQPEIDAGDVVTLW